MPGDYLTPWNRKPIEQQDLLYSVNDNGSGFPGKKNGITTFILSHCHIEEMDTWTGKLKYNVAKGKRTKAWYKQYAKNMKYKL